MTTHFFTDKRYTITTELCGHRYPHDVARFCGDFISSHDTLAGAKKACMHHADKRGFPITLSNKA